MIENIVKKFSLRSNEPTLAVEKRSKQPLMVIWGRKTWISSLWLNNAICKFSIGLGLQVYPFTRFSSVKLQLL